MKAIRFFTQPVSILLGMTVALCPISAQQPAISKDKTVMVVSKVPTTAEIQLTKADLLECFAFLHKLDKNSNLENRLKLYNDFTAKRFKASPIGLAAMQDSLKNRFTTSNNSASLLLDLLKKSNKISEPVYKFLKELDAKLQTSKKYATTLPIVQAAQKDLNSGRYAFDKKDIAFLSIQLMLKEAVAEHFGGVQARISGGDFTAEPCQGVDIDISDGLGYVNILGECFEVAAMHIGCHEGGGGGGSVDTPDAPAPCNTCPQGWVYDTYDCISSFRAPLGTTTFSYNGNFYYTPVNGNQCPAGGWYDGANCYYQPIPPTYVPMLNNGSYKGSPGNILLRVVPHCR
jgi:hypothetical protein